VAERADDEYPQPASAAMSEQMADWYVAFTHGQLQKVRLADGQWYLYVPQTIPDASAEAQQRAGDQ
jgi:hypothetical protein